MDIVYKARVFATAAHAAVKQVRKYTGEPYIVHPEEVVRIIAYHGATLEQLAASWLHDTVEDTGVTQDLIVYEFGPIIAEYVHWLTDQSTSDDGNRAVRKKMDADRLALAPPAVQSIKYADLISNTKSIIAHDPGFAKTYLQEKAYLLSVMNKGNPELYKLALQNIVG
jgi:(p)ppGpp synthase/HD superfamily hydrolase